VHGKFTSAMVLQLTINTACVHTGTGASDRSLDQIIVSPSIKYNEYEKFSKRKM